MAHARHSSEPFLGYFPTELGFSSPWAEIAIDQRFRLRLDSRAKVVLGDLGLGSS